MAKRDRKLVPRVNFFDGQKVTERDLDVEQIYHKTVLSNLVVDFHGAGIVRKTPFRPEALFDTRNISSDNPSKAVVESGSYDGMAIKLNSQPSDAVRGNRLEIEIGSADIVGRVRPKVLVVGKIFNGTTSGGLLNIELLEFDKNGKLITSEFYTEVIAVLFNNFSGGSGKTEETASKDSEDLITDSGGWMTVREVEPLAVFPATEMAHQVESPNTGLRNFITSSTAKSIEDELVIALGASNDINDLYFEIEPKEEIYFESDGDTAIAYGQKFLARTDNIQKVELLLSVVEDTTAAAGSEFDFSGEMVVSIHALADETSCSSDSVPNDLIGFDPEISPIVEVAIDQADLETFGYKLSDVPQPVSFNFSGTLIADPSIDPSVTEDKYYAIMVSRRGDNRTGTVALQKGYAKASRKADLGQPLSSLEEFGKVTSKFVEYDPIYKRYVDDSNSSLWFVVHSDAVEVTDGTAYSEDGVAITIPKTEEFVGSTEISYFARNISLSKVAEGTENYVMLTSVSSFSSPSSHPRTNNLAYKRIYDTAAISVVDSTELDSLGEDIVPLLLARVIDENVRDASEVTGIFDKPGLVRTNEIWVENPSSSLISSNLINRIITPDTDCDCNSRYRIVKAECVEELAGDLDGDNTLTSADLSELLDLVGNTINSETTERKILGGEIDVIDFLKADLNDDETVDGIDIGLLEDAIDGYENFTVSEKLKFLKLTVENILEEDNYPDVFTDVAASGSSTASTDSIIFTASDYKKALIIRVGDTVTIPTGVLDSGSYVIYGKSVAADEVTVTLSVTNADGTSVSFQGSSGFNVEIQSGTSTNMLADNNNLATIPYTSRNYSIDFIGAPFESRFIEACDLRREVGISFTEEEDNSCECDDSGCEPTNPCSPVYKTQTYVPGDLLVKGNILDEDGYTHTGDFEFSNIQMPLPPGSIQDCQVNLYESFIKAADNTCLTAAGYPAMKYSDGTYVGCEDSGSSTDLTKGRVKISQAICSLYVDALVDGYAIDGYGDASEVDTAVEMITQDYVEYSYNHFGDWTDDPGNSLTITTIDHVGTANTPALFELTSSTDATARYGRLNSPVAAQDFTGDFIIDFKAARATWPESSLLTGEVSSFATLTITNATTEATLKFGWRQQGTSGVKLFYSGSIENIATMAVVSTFDYEIDAPDDVGDEVLFRLRRINDVVSAYYIVPNKITITDGPLGEYIRIGENPEVQPGDGTVVVDYEMAQVNAPTAGLTFYTRLYTLDILSELVSSDTDTSMTISRTAATNAAERATVTFPVSLTKRTNITSASLTFTATSAGTMNDPINVIPLDIVDASNLGKYYDVPLNQDTSTIATFIPGTLALGETVEVSVTAAMVSFFNEAGHLPGYYKGFVVEADATADSSIVFDSDVTLTINYEDISTGVVFQVGISLNPLTGIASLNTKNILYDALTETNRTVINFGVMLKKAGFKNDDLMVSINDLSRIGVGTCIDESITTEEDECFFVVGDSGVGTIVEGPFPCNLVI